MILQTHLEFAAKVFLKEWEIRPKKKNVEMWTKPRPRNNTWNSPFTPLKHNTELRTTSRQRHHCVGMFPEVDCGSGSKITFGFCFAVHIKTWWIWKDLTFDASTYLTLEHGLHPFSSALCPEDEASNNKIISQVEKHLGNRIMSTILLTMTKNTTKPQLMS